MPSARVADLPPETVRSPFAALYLNGPADSGRAGERRARCYVRRVDRRGRRVRRRRSVDRAGVVDRPARPHVAGDDSLRLESDGAFGRPDVALDGPARERDVRLLKRLAALPELPGPYGPSAESKLSIEPLNVTPSSPITPGSSTVKFAFETSKKTFPSASTFTRACVVTVLGTITSAEPSFARAVGEHERIRVTAVDRQRDLDVVGAHRRDVRVRHVPRDGPRRAGRPGAARCSAR